MRPDYTGHPYLNPVCQKDGGDGGGQGFAEKIEDLAGTEPGGYDVDDFEYPGTPVWVPLTFGVGFGRVG